MAAVTVADLLADVELADDRHRDARAAFVARVVSAIAVEPDDVAVAEHHARFLAATRRSGTARGAHDLIVAATAVPTNRMIVTTDTGARLANLPGVLAVIAL